MIGNLITPQADSLVRQMSLILNLNMDQVMLVQLIRFLGVPVSPPVHFERGRAFFEHAIFDQFWSCSALRCDTLRFHQTAHDACAAERGRRAAGSASSSRGVARGGERCTVTGRQADV